MHLDFEKAFDKDNHNKLLKKVIRYQIKRKIGVWIRNFLNDIKAESR